MKRKKLIHWLGLLGMASLLSYTAAVLFAPLAYPGYEWMRQAVSDLSAVGAPSELLWRQLSCLHGPCGIVSIMAVCLFSNGQLSKTLRVGIYLFAAMNWVSTIGFTLFPLSESGFAGTFQDIMHAYVVTAAVVVLSILSLSLIAIGGFRKRRYPSLAIWAAAALLFMFIGAMALPVLPKEYFGVFERFGVFSATVMNAVLGVYLFNGFNYQEEKQKKDMA